MNTLVDLILANPIAPLFIGITVLCLVKKEDWLAQAKKQNQKPTMVIIIMVVGILLVGMGMMVTTGFRLRVEQNKHRGELSVKDTEIRLLNEKIERLKLN